MKQIVLVLTLLVLSLSGCARAPKYDVVIRHGTIYDGSGAAGKVSDLAILDDRIAAIGDLSAERGREEVDATGLDVAPGFINMLSHSETSLIEDGRSQGALRQGVMTALIEGAVRYAQAAGSPALEAYPIDTAVPGSTRNLFPGTRTAFERAGFVIVAQRSAERPVMRHLLGRNP